MIKAERQERIVGVVEKLGSISVHGIAEQLGVSEMTVRRDLEELSRKDQLIRVHGGARSLSADERSMLRREFTHSEKRSINADEKRAIAHIAASVIEERETVYLGTGTTVEQMVPLLPRIPLRIITNSLSVFNLLEGRSEFELCLVGGMYRRRTSAFVGPVAEDMVSFLGTDIAFIGANGIQGNAVTTSNMEEGKLQQLALDMADRRILVADSSKVGKRDFFSFYRLSDFDAVVMEPDASQEARNAVEEHTRVFG